MSGVILGPFNIDRVYLAVEELRQRLRRATAALKNGGVPYAVIGGNAVASWVSRVDKAAVRFTQDVDILLRRSDLPAARIALESAGFRYRNSAGMHMFLDGPGGTFREGVHIIFANEKVRPEYVAPAPDVDDSEEADEYRVVSMLALLRMKLTSFRRKDQVHVLDMIDVGIVDADWPAKLPPELAPRLQQLLDDPDG
jgi:hypothetical protein